MLLIAVFDLYLQISSLRATVKLLPIPKKILLKTHTANVKVCLFSSQEIGNVLKGLDSSYINLVIKKDNLLKYPSSLKNELNKKSSFLFCLMYTYVRMTPEFLYMVVYYFFTKLKRIKEGQVTCINL